MKRYDSHMEVAIYTVIYTVIGLVLFGELIGRLPSKIWEFALVVIYVSIGVFFASTFIRRWRKLDSIFERAHFFDRNTPYTIDSRSISLCLSRHSRRANSSDATHSVLCGALAEHYFRSGGLNAIGPNPTLRKATLRLRVDADAPVEYNFSDFSKYPYTHINISHLPLKGSKHIDLTLLGNPFIREIVLPYDLDSIFLEISGCPNLESIYLPSPNPVSVSFSSRLIDGVSQDFAVYVPRNLLLRYTSSNSKWSSIAVLSTDDSESELEFYEI